MKLDILAIGAHPDDIELASAGTLIKHQKKGKKIGVIDLTRGELGTRGSAEVRDKESAISARLLQLSARDNLKMKDGFFEIDQPNLIKIITSIRKYQPEVVLANAIHDRHPDHGRAAALVSRACFLSGLVKIDTNQKVWRPKAVYNYIQDRNTNPDFVVDITPFWNIKMESILAYSSQFYDPNSIELSSPISSKEFIAFLEARAREFGRMIGVEFAEGFTCERPMGIDDLLNIR